jgi:hypothetical protein
MTACNTFGKRPDGWGAQKPCVRRAEARIDFTSLTRSVFTCSKRLLFWTNLAVTQNYTHPEHTPILAETWMTLDRFCAHGMENGAF